MLDNDTVPVPINLFAGGCHLSGWEINIWQMRCTIILRRRIDNPGRIGYTFSKSARIKEEYSRDSGRENAGG